MPGESHGQRSLAGYSPWGCKELDMIKETKHAWTGAPLPPWARGCPAGQHNVSDISEWVNLGLSNQGGERMVEEGRTGRC